MKLRRDMKLKLKPQTRISASAKDLQRFAALVNSGQIAIEEQAPDNESGTELASTSPTDIVSLVASIASTLLHDHLLSLGARPIDMAAGSADKWVAAEGARITVARIVEDLRAGLQLEQVNERAESANVRAAAEAIATASSL